MIRVLHLRSGSGLYGADRVVLALAAATRAPFEAVVGGVVRPEEQSELCDEAGRRGLPARSFHSGRRFDLRCAREIASECARLGIALLHAHDFKSLFLALVASARLRIPVVATFHGETRSDPRVRAYELFARLLGHFTAGVVAVSRPLEQTLRRWCGSQRVVFIPNGIAAIPPCTERERREARALLGLDPAAIVLAVVGRLSPEKGHEVLLEALRKQTARPFVLFIGEGPLRARLEAVSAGLPVRFLGYLRDVRPIYAACDAVVLPSLREAMPLVALEAMAHGRPLIASAVGELPQLLAFGAGLLFPPGDSAALGQALAQLQGSQLSSLAACALERSRDYDDVAMAGSYAELYARAAGSSRLRALASSSR